MIEGAIKPNDDNGLTLSPGLNLLDGNSANSVGGGPDMQQLEELLAPLVLPALQLSVSKPADLG